MMLNLLYSPAPQDATLRSAGQPVDRSGKRWRRSLCTAPYHATQILVPTILPGRCQASACDIL